MLWGVIAPPVSPFSRQGQQLRHIKTPADDPEGLRPGEGSPPQQESASEGAARFPFAA